MVAFAGVRVSPPIATRPDSGTRSPAASLSTVDLPQPLGPTRAVVRPESRPNVYFHVATAYNILRHNGVELGKMDYLGPM